MTPPRTSSAQPKPKPKLRWFQFSMRTLVIIMTLVCGGLGWLIHDVREQDAVVKMIEQNGGYVEFGELSFVGRIKVRRWLFGDRAFRPITTIYLRRANTARLLQSRKLKQLQHLSLHQETDLSPLAGLKQLQFLYIANSQVTDLSPLAGLQHLKTLSTSNTQVSDLSPLAGLSGLTELYLGESQVNDLSPLAGLKRLNTLHVQNTQVSDLSPLAELNGLKEIWISEGKEVQIPKSLEKSIHIIRGR